MLNFIFISPSFPKTYYRFCERLKNNGCNVLGICDTPYNMLDETVINSLTEYYYVSSMEKYDEVYRAVAFFSFKYGKIDYLESNNEYWLRQDAKLREDFKTKNRKLYKKVYHFSQVSLIMCLISPLRRFLVVTGYKVVIKITKWG